MNLGPRRGGAGAAAVAFAVLAAVMVVVAPATLAGFTASTSDEANAWQTGNVAPATNFAATCISQNEVHLNWASSPTEVVTGYRIERRRNNEDTFTPLATVTPRTATSYTDTAAPFPSGLLSVGATVAVSYRISAEVAGTAWRSPTAQANTSVTVTRVLLVTVFTCNN